MKRGSWVVAYRSISDQTALKGYGKLAMSAIEAGNGRELIRASEVQTRESGLNRWVVIIEFENLERAIATYNSDAYQSALHVLGSGAQRDFRIVEGL